MAFLALSVSAQQAKEAAAQLVIPDGTPIELRLVKSVSSNHAHSGDRLDFIVVKAVNLGGYTLCPAGTKARGTITEVKGKRFLGIGAKITLRLDSVELADGESLKVRASKVVKGNSRTKLMAGAMIATGIIFIPAAPVFLLTRGHASTVVKTTEITRASRWCDDSGGSGPVTLDRQDFGPCGDDGLSSAASFQWRRPRRRHGEFDLRGAREAIAGCVSARRLGADRQVESVVCMAPDAAWNRRRARAHGQVLSVRPGAGLLVRVARSSGHRLSPPSLRIWKTDYTENGTPIWVGSATHDVAIEIAKNGRLINHRIDPKVDDERDFIGGDLTQTASVSSQEYVNGVSPVFEAQTASGEAYHSDSRILLLDLAGARFNIAAGRLNRARGSRDFATFACATS